MKFLSSDCFTACLVVLYKGLIIPSCRRILRSLSKDLYSPTTNRRECHQDVGHFACCTGLEEERVFLLLVYGNSASRGVHCHCVFFSNPVR